MNVHHLPAHSRRRPRTGALLLAGTLALVPLAPAAPGGAVVGQRGEAWTGTFSASVRQSTVSTYEDGEYTTSVTAALSGTARPTSSGDGTTVEVVVETWEQRVEEPSRTCRWVATEPLRYVGAAVLASPPDGEGALSLTVDPGTAGWPSTRVAARCTSGPAPEPIEIDLDDAMRVCLPDEWGASVPGLPLPRPRDGVIDGTEAVRCSLAEDAGAWTSDTTTRAALMAPGVEPGAADLAARIARWSGAAEVGRPESVLVRVHNRGPAAAAGVVLRVVLPRGTRLVASPTLAGGRCVRADARHASCRVAALAVGRDAVVRLRVRPLAPRRRAVLTARVGSATPDPVPADNRARAVRRIVPAR